jgi:monoamine oxidase
LQGEEAQSDWAIQQLSVLFGSSIKSSVLATCATPFDREPWIGGGYTYCRYGTGNQRPALAEPIEDRLFFAGEACSPDHPGTAHGAWLSGVAAIEEIST